MRVEHFSGKVVIDAMNPLDFSGGFPPKLSVNAGRARLASAFSERCPMPGRQGVQHDRQRVLRGSSFSEGEPTMLIAGDDADAKRTVGDVLADFGWSEPVDIGGIEGSRELEAICIAWVKIGGQRGAWARVQAACGIARDAGRTCLRS